MNYRKKVIAFFLTIMLIQSGIWIKRPSGIVVAEEKAVETKIGLIGGGLPT
jgi:hypothetical protein